MPIPRHSLVPALLGVLALLPLNPAAGQGCAPVRYSFHGPEQDVYLTRGTWQVAFAYRRFISNKLIQGGDEVAGTAPPSVVKSQSLFTSVTYAMTDRLAFTVTLPFSHGSHETNYPDGGRHINTVTGLGDLSVVGSYWVGSTERRGGNLGVALGVKVPTGSNDVIRKWWKQDGSTIPFPAHQSVQLGDGGWGLITAVQGFLPVAPRVSVHADGYYLLNPKKVTEVRRSPTDTTRWAVPDSWNAVAGVSFVVSPAQGLSASLEGVFYGTPRRDLIGGKNGDGHRLPATAGYLNPAVQLTRGHHLFTLGVPVRVYKDFQPSYLDEAAGKPGGGGLAKYVVLAQYIVRI